MALPKTRIAQSESQLRRRVLRLLSRSRSPALQQGESDLFSGKAPSPERTAISTPTRSISEFLSYLCAAAPTGEIFLFGGLLRDVALFGARGFESDADVVVEGHWDGIVRHLNSMGAQQNRFGGFRLSIDGWPVDIWHARDTWAVRQGHVRYQGIASLTSTTIVNWDAILMDWRTRRFITRARYFEEVQNRLLDIVLTENPNPLGAAVRAFRHFCLMDASKTTVAAARYLSSSAREFTPAVILAAESRSYPNPVINREVLGFFSDIESDAEAPLQQQFVATANVFEQHSLFE